MSWYWFANATGILFCIVGGLLIAKALVNKSMRSFVKGILLGAAGILILLNCL